MRNERDVTSENDIRAIQATINDHRTMIEDNKIAIINMINNGSVNNNFQRYFARDRQASVAPRLNDWRDILLLFVSLFVASQVLYYCLCQVQLKPCDFLIAQMLQRHQKSQKIKQQTVSNSPLHGENFPQQASTNVYPTLPRKSQPTPSPLLETAYGPIAAIHRG